MAPPLFQVPSPPIYLYVMHIGISQGWLTRRFGELGELGELERITSYISPSRLPRIGRAGKIRLG